MDNEMNYRKSLNKSTNKKVIRIGSQNYVVNAERFKEFKKNVIAITVSVALAIATFGYVKDNIKFHHEKVDISLEVYDQMVDKGYKPVPAEGEWDYRYELLDGIDPFDLSIYMGSEDALSILQYRGYESWDDYAQQEGYKNQRDWYNAQKKKVINPETKSKGGK